MNISTQLNTIKTLLLLLSLFITFNSFSSKEDTLAIYKVLDESKIIELEKLFKNKFIKTVDIHEFNDSKFNSLLKVLRNNKDKFYNLKITSPKLELKYKKLLEFKIKELYLNTFNFKTTVKFPVWITDFKVEKLDIKMSNGDEITNINFGKFKNLEVLKIKGGYLPLNSFDSIVKLRFLTNLTIDIGVCYDYDFLLKSLKNLKYFSANLNKTYLYNLPYHECLEKFTVYDADIYFIKKIHLLSFLNRINMHTKVDIVGAKHIIKGQKSNPFISFYKKGYSANNYIAKKIEIKKEKNGNF